MSDLMRDRDRRMRFMYQGILMLVVSPIGALGSVAFLTDETNRNIPLGLFLGAVTLAAIGLGVWLIRQARAIRLPPGPPSESSPR